MLTFNNVNSVFRVMQRVVPLGHVGNAEEIAHAVLFLATDEASHISGVCLPVDSGVTAR
ncbi:SDR family oxidoreductase [Exiguobacterium sp. ERU656]|uniref:SDR family oxidoreductase n=1 Tax=Exiguobacterium sp. ERU656 TaxID=2751217 RepID=UPI001BEAF56F|nr:SDR family oxidoreductase [Exiguobacterium sp. ERU656]